MPQIDVTVSWPAEAAEPQVDIDLGFSRFGWP